MKKNPSPVTRDVFFHARNLCNMLIDQGKTRYDEGIRNNLINAAPSPHFRSVLRMTVDGMMAVAPEDKSKV